VPGDLCNDNSQSVSMRNNMNKLRGLWEVVLSTQAYCVLGRLVLVKISWIAALPGCHTSSRVRIRQAFTRMSHQNERQTWDPMAHLHLFSCLVVRVQISSQIDFSQDNLPVTTTVSVVASNESALLMRPLLVHSKRCQRNSQF
jgi:hypothetical protein